MNIMDVFSIGLGYWSRQLVHLRASPCHCHHGPLPRPSRVRSWLWDKSWNRHPVRPHGDGQGRWGAAGQDSLLFKPCPWCWQQHSGTVRLRIRTTITSTKITHSPGSLRVTSTTLHWEWVGKPPLSFSPSLPLSLSLSLSPPLTPSLSSPLPPPPRPSVCSFLVCLPSLFLIANAVASTRVNENGSAENGPQRSLLDSLTEKLKTMENEDSPSDEESDEQNNLIFTETASSAGSESPLLTYLYHSAQNLWGTMGVCRFPNCKHTCSSEFCYCVH